MNLKILHNPPVTQLLRLATKVSNPGLVFYGHGVVKKITDPDVQKVHLSFSEFEWTIHQMEKLKYRFISMEQLQDIILTKNFPDYPWIHLTFDDGYKNNYTEIYPYLKKKGIPFTIFITINHILNKTRFDTDRMAIAIKHTLDTQGLNQIVQGLGLKYINNNQLIDDVLLTHKYLNTSEKGRLLDEICQLLSHQEWEKYYKIYEDDEVMSENDLKTLSCDPLVHIGSHGCNHFIQTTLTEDERNFELTHSRELIKNIIGKEINTFGYQNGNVKDFSDQTIQSCKKADYQFCFTTIKTKLKTNTNPMIIPRLPFTNTYIPYALLKTPFIS